MRRRILLGLAGIAGAGLLTYSIGIKLEEDKSNPSQSPTIEETVIVKKESQVETLERRVLTAETKPVSEVKSNEEQQKELENVYLIKNKLSKYLCNFYTF